MLTKTIDFETTRTCLVSEVRAPRPDTVLLSEKGVTVISGSLPTRLTSGREQVLDNIQSTWDSTR